METNLNSIFENSKEIMKNIEILKTLVVEEEAIKNDMDKTYKEYESGEISKEIYEEIISSKSKEIANLKQRQIDLLYKITEASRQIYELTYSEIREISENIE
ncbi:MAG: hypothetical protein OH319_00050 [Candidatus Parvarchaeota archaeon]|nr:hypothetical protein [Candidatus Jingweiarchaeum tengchongense]MCW1298459.1 hypothetical protein [Candidatus Jingweiarchaeum tengchongense]MCW1300551.1 hypothetical protein [Candidatus Jingweiarchaeum tengchongense]MCW1304974.1 hypothetical protein [Candidatus Jingweiarchaeum tengchongense]MCW1309301.1 hypothetical protein [Candidatus Jingweiarchaeum tengchongense]